MNTPLSFLALTVSAIGALASLGCGATTTVASAPTVTAESVSHITATDATLEAQINPNGSATTYRFQLDYGCGVAGPKSGGAVSCMSIATIRTPAQEIPASNGTQSVSLDPNDAGVTLHPDTEYRYSIEATNSAGATKYSGHEIHSAATKEVPFQIFTTQRHRRP